MQIGFHRCGALGVDLPRLFRIAGQQKHLPRLDFIAREQDPVRLVEHRKVPRRMAVEHDHAERAARQIDDVAVFYNGKGVVEPVIRRIRSHRILGAARDALCAVYHVKKAVPGRMVKMAVRVDHAGHGQRRQRLRKRADIRSIHARIDHKRLVRPFQQIAVAARAGDQPRALLYLPCLKNSLCHMVLSPLSFCRLFSRHALIIANPCPEIKYSVSHAAPPPSPFRPARFVL